MWTHRGPRALGGGHRIVYAGHMLYDVVTLRVPHVDAVREGRAVILAIKLTATAVGARRSLDERRLRSEQ